MKNALITGVFIGILSALWIAAMQFFGFNPQNVEESNNNWLEYTSILIPFFGLYFGIKRFKKSKNRRLSFIEAIFEGFKIIAIGGLIAAVFSFIYIQVFAKDLTVDYMERVFAAVVIGLLFTLVNALLLMDTAKRY